MESIAVGSPKMADSLAEIKRSKNIKREILFDFFLAWHLDQQSLKKVSYFGKLIAEF